MKRAAERLPRATSRAGPAPSVSVDGVNAVVGLQRAAGNRAVGLLLQRQVAAVALLTPTQAAIAVSFYRGKPELYPADVIIRIQKSVHTTETGKPDNAMVQGVAGFQQESVLTVDGMAGPRTLPRIFASGLATKVDQDSYVKSAKAAAARWATLPTPEARARALFDGLVPLLAAEKVTLPTLLVDDTGKASGVFTHKPWTITLNRSELSNPTIDDAKAEEFAGTVYHEARHTEQFHKMARMLAGRGRTAEQISQQMEIPIEVARDAVAVPLPKGAEFATAAQQFDSVYGPGRAEHDRAERNSPSAAELRTAKNAVDADPSPANMARLAQVTADFKAYHNLPTENDAFATEIDFTTNWDEASQPP